MAPPVQDKAPDLTGSGAPRRGDGIFRGLSTGAGVLLLAVMAAIGVFLVVRSLPALEANAANFFTESEWFANRQPPVFGIAALVFYTLVSSLLALLIATPVAIGVALFISHYAPRKVAGGLGTVVDLLAAVPSVVYGLWGLIFLVPKIEELSFWIAESTGMDAAKVGGKSILTASVVLAIMILPYISSVSREVFLRAPRDREEAALALGATRWEMIKMVVLPFGRSGVVSASMLGLGRALGETIAVALILSATTNITFNILQTEGSTIASNIAIAFGEASDLGKGALIASGLVLFVITLAVNSLARVIVAKRAEAT